MLATVWLLVVLYTQLLIIHLNCGGANVVKVSGWSPKTRAVSHVCNSCVCLSKRGIMSSAAVCPLPWGRTLSGRSLRGISICSNHRCDWHPHSTRHSDSPSSACEIGETISRVIPADFVVRKCFGHWLSQVIKTKLRLRNDELIFKKS